ncbi:MAG TPA: precorrin-8X methylmutase [Dongiaceae bacterium]|jgi:precorrin-8X/cobalt-precorrin-8 methylmutase|nr:precorrin-8X methylmutase [Dongiaceae bacterium]
MLAYVKDPAEIYRQSFEIIRREAPIARLPDDIASVVVRLIHACGMTDIAESIAFSDDVVANGRNALEKGAPILCDTAMTAAGIIRRHLPAENEILIASENPAAADHAGKIGNTRSAAAVDLWGERPDGSVVVIGNAPTALFRLIERIDLDGYRPAAILAFPVGFVGAAESKELLAAGALGIPFITLRGRRGGSAMAAAALNALLIGEGAA